MIFTGKNLNQIPNFSIEFEVRCINNYVFFDIFNKDGWQLWHIGLKDLEPVSEACLINQCLAWGRQHSFKVAKVTLFRKGKVDKIIERIDRFPG